jgi:hypothetical protein
LTDTDTLSPVPRAGITRPASFHPEERLVVCDDWSVVGQRLEVSAHLPGNRGAT